MNTHHGLLGPVPQAGTIRVRLTLWYVLLLAMILLLFSGALYFLLDNSLDAHIDSDLRVSSEQAVGVVQQQDGQLVVQRAEGESELSPLAERGVLARVLTVDGKIIESVGPFSTLPVLPTTLEAAKGGQPFLSDATLPSDGSLVRLYTISYAEAGKLYGYVQVGETLKSAQDTLQVLLLVMAIAVPVVLLLASAGGLFLANRALSPIDRITQAARRIGAEDLTQRLDLNLPDDEVGRLARTFDAMLDRLHEAFHRQRQFTSDASHEMRTPLTIMKGDIGLALNRQRSAAAYRETLASLDEEVDRLTRLVEDLLLLARADSPQSLTRSDEVDLAEVLGRVVEQVRPLAAAGRLDLSLAVDGQLHVLGDVDKLVRLFLNLFDNAIKYTPPGGRITVRAIATEPRALIVEVVDTGPGIPTEQCEQIFERFYRSDAARSRSDGGAGLGLSIAQWIAVAHGGNITVQSTPGAGSVFRVRLPRHGS
ncbi:MAG: ATP-binding protein [Chloroflexota bacterium]|nr:ATP-binding protein [Chloroflexota bacterium]